MIYLRSCLGVEMRQEDLLISCVQSNLSGGVFTHFLRVADYRAREKSDVRREIDAFFKSQRIPRDNVVFGVPRSDVIVRCLDLPAEVGDNLKQVMVYQVQSLEPTEEEKFYYDYQLLRSGPNGKRIPILLVMVRKTILDAHLLLLRELGIRPSMVTTTAAALANLFLQDRRDIEHKTFVLADVHAGGMEILALRDGNLVYSRESLKTEGVGWRDLVLREVEEAAGKIRMGPDDAIESIVFAGPASEDIHQEISATMEGCQLLTQRLRFEMPQDVRRRLPEATASLALAYSGLGGRPAVRLNLLPADLRERQTRWAYVPAIALGLSVLTLLVGFGLRPVIQKRILIRQLDQEILSLQPRVDKVLAIRTQAQQLEKRINFLEGLMRERDMNLDVLRELTKILPPDTFLTMYQNDKGTIQLSGSALSAPDLLPKLDRSPFLKEMGQRGTIFRDAQTGKDRFTFEGKLERQP
jgi:Tfp pilus assembly protein PilN